MFPHTLISAVGIEPMLHHHHMPTPMEQQPQQRSRWKPDIEVAPNCPRCASTNTKFCYYNNYSLSQPRYFCKACRRYWTKGGSLRNVPVGGGCRKKRRGKSSSRHHQTTQRPFTSVSDPHQNNNNGSHRDIDMALVFAKFLNPKQSVETETMDNNNNNGSSSSNNYLTRESVETENMDTAVVQSQNKALSLSDPVVVQSSDADAGVAIQNFGREELSLGEIDELEKLLGVCGDEGGLWSDVTLSSSVTWEPPLKEMQFHDLEYSMPLNEDDAQLLLPITSASTVNSISDTCWSNWSSFDLSTMEAFSSTP